MGLSDFIKTNNINGAIFDTDGTLNDSMVRWGEIYAKLVGYLKIMLPQGFDFDDLGKQNCRIYVCCIQGDCSENEEMNLKSQQIL